MVKINVTYPVQSSTITWSIKAEFSLPGKYAIYYMASFASGQDESNPAL